MITWKITNMERIVKHNEQDDVVCNVHYYAYDSDENDWYGYCFGNCFLDLSNISGFVDYQSLTEEQVVQWVKDWHTPEQVQSIEDGIAQVIEEKRYTRRELGLPWA